MNKGVINSYEVTSEQKLLMWKDRDEYMDTLKQLKENNWEEPYPWALFIMDSILEKVNNLMK